MNLRDYIRLIRRQWIIITAVTLLGAVGGLAAGLFLAPSYTAQTQLFVAIQSSGSVQELQQGNTFTQARVASYVQTVETPLVLQPVVDSLSLDVSAGELADSIEAEADINTVIITINAESPSPVLAASTAQGVAESLIAAVEELEARVDGGPSPVKLSVVTPAAAPAAPSSPGIVTHVLAGLLLGLIGGLLFAVARGTLDTRLRTESDLRRVTDAPLLGGIAFDADAVKMPLLTQVAGQSPRAESFRQIRTNLQFAHVSHKSKAVLVTSSLPGEGKSTTATNLAIAIAQGGQSVVLVDADLRRPRVDEYLGLERNAGLTTALIGRADVEDLLQPWGEDELYVLTAGQIPPNPSELLGSDAMKQLILRLENKFDAVIIDAPPLLPVTDAAVLSQQVGGVVLVIGSSKVKLPDLQKSLGNLEMVNADLLGVVINLLPTKGPDAYSYTYYSYDSVKEPELHAGTGSGHLHANDGDDPPRRNGAVAADAFDEAVLGLRREQPAHRDAQS